MTGLPLGALGAAGLGVGLWLVALYLARNRPRRAGRLASVDRRAFPGPTLRSTAWRLAGRPDEIWELPGGTLVPVELKSRRVPSRGPPASHRAQLAAYCLLLEETTGRSPPFGILRYGDGREFELPWDATTRRWLWEIRTKVSRPYAGEADPSGAKCGRCAFAYRCDRSWAVRRDRARVQ